MKKVLHNLGPGFLTLKLRFAKDLELFCSCISDLGQTAPLFSILSIGNYRKVPKFSDAQNLCCNLLIEAKP